MAFHQNAVYLTGAGLAAIAFNAFDVTSLGHPSLDFLVRPWAMPGTIDLVMMGLCGVIAAAGMWLLTARDFLPREQLIRFDFARADMLYPSLMAIGLLYNLGIWVDKFMFWYFPDTSDAVIGHLQASVIYDLPVFLSYLSIIPGMAVFLVRFETDFVEWYDKFYNAVRDGGSLDYIEQMRDEQVEELFADHDVLPQRHRADLGDDDGHVAANLPQPLAELFGVGHRRRQRDDEDVLGQVDDHLFPDSTPEAVGEVVDLVHDDVTEARQGGRTGIHHVAQHLGRHDDDGSLAVDGGVPGEQPDVGGAVAPTEIGVLLVGQGLDRRRVEGDRKSVV